MTFQQEFASWRAPAPVENVDTPPELGAPAPSHPLLHFPRADGKPTIIAFLRHCGCPFAEKSFRTLAKLSTRYKSVHFVAVSHSSQSHTDKWIVEVGGEWDVEVVVDESRSLYAAWGLGVSSYYHVLNPWSLFSVYKLARDEKIWNRGTESGNRWQMGGAFAVDGEGKVVWGRAAKAADEVPDWEVYLKQLGVKVVPHREEVRTSGFL